MIPISDEVMNVLSQRLKLGEGALPNIRVEVDRLAFIPGRTEEFRHIVTEQVPIISTESVWVDESSNGIYNGSTQANAQEIFFRLRVKRLIVLQLQIILALLVIKVQEFIKVLICLMRLERRFWLHGLERLFEYPIVKQRVLVMP